MWLIRDLMLVMLQKSTNYHAETFNGMTFGHKKWLSYRIVQSSLSAGLSNII